MPREDGGRTVVGVFSAAARAARRRLFDALAEACDVDVVGRDPGEWWGIDAGIVFGTDSTACADLVARGIPCLVAPAVAVARPRDRLDRIQLGDADSLDIRLRHRTLHERGAAPLVPLEVVHGDTVHARGAQGALWISRRTPSASLHVVALPAAELPFGARLKDHLRAGHFLGLLPVVHFLREVCGTPDWERPALRGCLVLDDPNLHWPSYGHLSYPRLARQAETHGYHVGIAMVPIDGRLVHRGAVEIFRQSRVLSLLVHGNDHVRLELDRPMSRAAALALSGQALRRMARVERRHGVSVCRVMVPPHDDHLAGRGEGCDPTCGACTEEMMTAMLLTGFEALCSYGPRAGSSGRALQGWGPADMHVGGGLPGIHRLPLDAPIDELVLRAFLDQPIVLFGHHGDLGHDPDALTDAAARVDRLGDVRWSSLTDIIRSNYLVRRRGDTMRVRAFSRRFRLQPRPGPCTVVVETPWTPGGERDTVTIESEAGGLPLASGRRSAPLPLPPLPVTVRLCREHSVEPHRVPSSPPRVWPVLRRGLTEGRDRCQPLLARGRAQLTR